jgi:ribosomal protein S18 acetylase RimI-like enzyme
LSNIVVRVAEHAMEASLLGAGCYLSTPLAPFGLGSAYSDSVYIPALGISEAYRGGWRVPDGSRIGECILEDLLSEIQGAWESQMPRVWAVVDSKNEPCQRLLGNCGFSIVKAEEGSMDMWVRRAGLDPEWRCESH